MKNRVSFRDFEERDIDFVYRAKNNIKIQKDIVKDIQGFSYQEAIDWVNGCMKQNQNYKFWAICTNDEFQNIVGWCGISSIDYTNRKVCARGITIVNPKYTDGIAWYETYKFMSEYVFTVLNFNRFYTITLTSNIQSMMFNERLFLNSREGLMKQAIYKNGKYHDVAIHAILKEDYQKLKDNGMSIETFLENFKKITNPEVGEIRSLEDFISIIRNRLSITDKNILNKDTCFRDLEEWSSLWALEMYSIMEQGFKKKVDVYKVIECDTVEHLYNYFVENPESSNNNVLSIDFEDDINDIKGF